MTQFSFYSIYGASSYAVKPLCLFINKVALVISPPGKGPILYLGLHRPAYLTGKRLHRGTREGETRGGKGIRGVGEMGGGEEKRGGKGSKIVE